MRRIRPWCSPTMCSRRLFTSHDAGGPRPPSSTKTATIDVLEGPFYGKSSAARDFLRFRRAGTPVLLRNLASSWPAVSDPTRQWSCLARLRQRHGGHVVPVEAGHDYMSAERVETDLAFFLHYLEVYAAADETKKAAMPRLYLAQHQLLDQIPDLEEDLELHALKDLIPLDSVYLKNAWIGPQGSVSPLHRDPYDNLYIQVHGEKVWRLWDPIHSDRLQRSSDPLQPNTSLVDPKDPELALRHPTFPIDQQLLCRIRPGDALFVPARWWHHVEAMTMTMSVSLWWVGTGGAAATKGNTQKRVQATEE